MRLPTANGQWSYATTTLMVQLWCNAMAEEAYEHVAQTKLGQSLRRTRGTHQPVTTTPAPALDPAPALTPDMDDVPPDAATGGGVKPGPG